jgi:mono/diheme cytochrome c family protein
MKRTSFAVLTMLCVMATMPLAQDAKQIDRAQKIYVEKKCANCHSIAGKGNKKGPLDEVGTKLSADEIRQWIANPVEMTKKTKAARKPAMKDASLPPEDVDAMVAYMLTLKKK